MIKLLNPEKVERKRSEAREGLTLWHFLVDLMEGHLI
ncbi:hypothetical protein BT93_H2134 [Corymbia citriodora subsp. variegata]|nr:hypothetical protein BT93_H2134 [Corymbia citriodora subsp. variegata]